MVWHSCKKKCEVPKTLKDSTCGYGYEHSYDGVDALVQQGHSAGGVNEVGQWLNQLLA